MGETPAAVQLTLARTNGQRVDVQINRCKGAPARLALNAAQNGEGGHKVRLLLVVTDVVTGAPLQAAQLVC